MAHLLEVSELFDGEAGVGGRQHRQRGGGIFQSRSEAGLLQDKTFVNLRWNVYASSAAAWCSAMMHSSQTGCCRAPEGGCRRWPC